MKHFYQQALPIVAATALVLSACQAPVDHTDQDKNAKTHLETLPSQAQPHVPHSKEEKLTKKHPGHNNIPATDKAQRDNYRHSVELNQTAFVTDNKAKSKRMQLQQATLHTAPTFGVQTPTLPAQSHTSNSERYPDAIHNSVKQVSEAPVSTFSIDVDTAAYSNVRRFLMQGQVPNRAAVRLEEMINYFSYDYPQPDNGQPFSVTTEIGPSPWNANKRLLHIGIQGDKISSDKRPASNLVFLIDVSGSMQSDNKLGLLKSALKLLTQQLDNNDHVSIVVYAGRSGTQLSPTPGNNKMAINRAIDQLSAGGSTHGSAGIQAAYALAQQNFVDGAINRIILATDGDFNVGASSDKALKRLIETHRDAGIGLSVLGFGRGNYNDSLMQTLAQNGNGNAYYIDTLNEARKVLVDELSATLMTIAKDVKIQIEFNPQWVSEYRLIGYETRALKREDFNNDSVDAGEIGAGHSVTALYEISLAGDKGQMIDKLRYQSEASSKTQYNTSDELAFLRLRYKTPTSTHSELLEFPIHRHALSDDLAATSNNFRLSAAVAAFGQLLRHDATPSTITWNELQSLVTSAKGEDSAGYRAELIQLIKLAEALEPQLAIKH